MSGASCAWCNRAFTPRVTGGYAQRFCRLDCRRAYEAAARRWVTAAVAAGTQTVDALRNGAAATRVASRRVLARADTRA